MKVGYYNGYAQGLADGRAQALQDFERILAVLREELADARRDAAGQSHRADAACDLLLGHLGARAISLEGEKKEVERQERHIESVKSLVNIPDPTDELPYGHPQGLYSSEKEAMLAFEDVPEGLNG